MRRSDAEAHTSLKWLLFYTIFQISLSLSLKKYMLKHFDPDVICFRKSKAIAVQNSTLSTVLACLWCQTRQLKIFKKSKMCQTTTAATSGGLAFSDDRPDTWTAALLPLSKEENVCPTTGAGLGADKRDAVNSSRGHNASARRNKAKGCPTCSNN